MVVLQWTRLGRVAARRRPIQQHTYNSRAEVFVDTLIWTVEMKLYIAVLMATLMASPQGPTRAGAAAGGIPLHKPLKDGDVFDYIVVGAGAAGGAAAARLALGGHHVLLLEAGGRAGFLTKIPNIAMSLMGSEFDWFYETVPNNKSCLSHSDRQCRFSRGRCLGGSTSINDMLYVRGNPHDYDFDVPGWSWPDLKPFFLKYEGLQDLNRLPPSSHRFHNTLGRVAIGAFGNSSNPWHERIMKGLMALKFPFNFDVNAVSQIGVSRVFGFVSKGERVSTATAYLEASDVREKLRVAPNMRCTGVIIDENNVAYGVTVMKGKVRSKIMKFYVKHEVILSAGTIGSAQLLMLSGIGVADHLQRMGIPVRADLPVGENLSDHVLSVLFIKVDHESSATNLFNVLRAKGLDLLQWLATRKGPMASVGITDIMGFANTQCYDFNSKRLLNKGPECSIPSIQIIFSYIERYISRIAPRELKRFFSTNVFNQILDANKNSALLVVSPVLLQPKSRGWIRLASADPTAPPAISPNYLDDESDVRELVKAIAIVEHLLQTEPFKQNNASLLKLELPGCGGDEAGEEAGYWACYVRHMSSSAQHAAGAAALGGVLDGALRVRRVRALRVADLGVLPRPPRGNTAAAAIAIGERLAHIVLEERNGQK